MSSKPSSKYYHISSKSLTFPTHGTLALPEFPGVGETVTQNIDVQNIEFHCLNFMSTVPDLFGLIG